MLKHHIRWLYKELPRLVSDGVLDENSAQSLRDHYGEIGEMNFANLLLILFGILGSLLVGGGIILIIANNWDWLNISTKTILAFAPLTAALLLGFWTLYRHNDSAVWREPAAGFLITMAAACYAMITQIYFLGGQLSDFLFVWIIISIPVACAFRSVLGYLLLMILIPSWAGETGSFSVITNSWMWIVFLAAMPFPLYYALNKRLDIKARIVYLATIVSLAVMIFISLDDLNIFSFSGYYLLFLTIFALLLSSGRLALRGFPLYFNEYKVIGALGLYIMLIFVSITELWQHEFSRGLFRYDLSADPLLFYTTIGVLLSIVAGWVFTTYRVILSKQLSSVLAALTPAAVGLCLLLVPEWSQAANKSDYILASGLANIFFAALGFAILVEGAKSERLAKVSSGTIVLATLILIRFFDTEMSLLTRGIGFIVVGLILFLVNFLYARNLRNKRAGRVS